jgi:hypothetical protein
MNQFETGDRVRRRGCGELKIVHGVCANFILIDFPDGQFWVHHQGFEIDPDQIDEILLDEKKDNGWGF